ncbi:MAG: hypothetical protein ACFFDT_41015, partial [Candidatus Hodarchaeota archaeon]
MKFLNFIDDIGVSYKLIGVFLALACLSGVVGLYSITQIDILNHTVSDIVEINVEQADWSMETIVAMEAQLITIHAALLGEEDMLDEYTPAYNVLKNGFANLTLLLEGTTQEVMVSDLELQYEDFHEVCNGSNGVFISMDAYEEANQWVDVQFWRIDSLQDKLDADLSLLEAMVVQNAENNATPFDYNTTLTDNVMELNLLVWRCGDRARMYMSVPLNDSAEYNALRATYRIEYCDSASMAAETKYVQNGLEKEFTDLLTEAETNYAQAYTRGEVNSTCLDILEDVNSSFVFAAHDLGPLYDPFASSIRCPEDGVFVSQDILVTSWVAAATAMETA